MCLAVREGCLHCKSALRGPWTRNEIYKSAFIVNGQWPPAHWLKLVSDTWKASTVKQNQKLDSVQQLFQDERAPERYC